MRPILSMIIMAAMLTGCDGPADDRAAEPAPAVARDTLTSDVIDVLADDFGEWRQDRPGEFDFPDGRRVVLTGDDWSDLERIDVVAVGGHEHGEETVLFMATAYAYQTGEPPEQSIEKIGDGFGQLAEGYENWPLGMIGGHAVYVESFGKEPPVLALVFERRD